MPLRRGAGALALCLAVGVVLSSGALSTGITFEDPNCAALDASCSSERISFDGEKLLVPGHCETGTCSSLNSDMLSLKTRVSSIESTISQVQAELSSSAFNMRKTWRLCGIPMHHCCSRATRRALIFMH